MKSEDEIVENKIMNTGKYQKMSFEVEPGTDIAMEKLKWSNMSKTYLLVLMHLLK